MTTPFVSSSVTATRTTHKITIDALLGDWRWTNPAISYSFPASNSPLLWSTLPGSGYGPQFGDGEPWHSTAKPLTTNDQINFELALQKWANVASIGFIKLFETANEVGDIRVAYSEDPDEFILAWSYLPGFSVRAGDIWINTLGLLNFQDWNPGSISFESILHEIGHALGLKHPFFDSKKPTATTLPADLDNTSHTIMSYTYANLQGEKGNEFSFHPTTPMVLDIAAIQYLYGSNNNYHSGNDSYVFDDESVYHETIWDAGGIDTIQYTGTIATSIDLNITNGSYIGQPVYVQSNGVNLGLPIPNVWIAAGVTIENAIAGQGNDILIGNTSGSNTLDGGSGIDTVIVRSQRSQYTLEKISNGYTVADNTNANNRDTLIAVDRLKFDDVGIALDFDAHAGEVAKLLGAVLGAAAVANREYVSIGLAKADNGLNYEQLGEFAIAATGLKTSDEIVTLLWRNLFGSSPSRTEKSPYLKMLDSNQISIGALAVAAADSEFNHDNINLVGLMQTGLEFI